MQVKAPIRLQHPVQFYQPRGHHHQIRHHLIVPDEVVEGRYHLADFGRGFGLKLDVGIFRLLAPVPCIVKGRQLGL